MTAFTGGSFYGNCAESDPGALSVEQGTSIGFTDLYPAHFHGQNLELRGVPAGIYVLVHRANPDQRLEEIDYTNNDASLRVRLSWSGGKPHVGRSAPARPRPTASEATGPSAAGSAKRSGSPVGSSGRRPSRSSRNAFIECPRPRCRPRRVADHRRLVRFDPELCQRVAKDLRVRLRASERARADRAVGVEPVMGHELVEVAAAVRDQADLDPVGPQLGERREASS